MEREHFYLIIEDDFKRFSWCQLSRKILYEEARKKRIPLSEISSLSEIGDGHTQSVLFLLSPSIGWITRHAAEAHKRQIRAVALSDLDMVSLQACQFPLSFVSCNLGESIETALAYLKSCGRTRTAFYGLNPESTSDPVRAAVFERITGQPQSIYPFLGTYESTFRAFQPHLKQYDSIICTNDYAALTMIHQFRQIGFDRSDWPYLISHGNFFLSCISSPTITSFSQNYDQFGQAAVSLALFLLHNPWVYSSNVYLKSDLNIRETTGMQSYAPQTVLAENPLQPVSPKTNHFFHDSDILSMAKLESLLTVCDATDLTIIEQLRGGLTNDDIAHRCFISSTALKYRIHKMEAMLDTPTRKSLIDFLKLYL